MHMLTRRSESSTTPQRGQSWIGVVIVAAIVALMPIFLVLLGLLPFSGRNYVKAFQEFITTVGAPMFVVGWWGWLAALVACGMFIAAGVFGVRLLERFVSSQTRPRERRS
jgi:hypothetical protein